MGSAAVAISVAGRGDFQYGQGAAQSTGAVGQRVAVGVQHGH